MIKNLILSYLEMIQDMWQPWPDDPLLSGMNKLMAMLLVALGLCTIGLCGWFVMLCVCHPIVIAYIGVPVFLLYALTYAIVHLKLPKEKEDGDDIRKDLAQ